MTSPLAQYGTLLRLRWRWLVWGVLVALVATTAVLIAWPPLYRSEATVFVRTPGDVSMVQDGGDSYARARTGTYAALATSTSVLSRVIADLGLDLEPDSLARRIKATQQSGTALFDVGVSGPSGEEAQRTATVLLSELATTVQSLESVPGSLIPRAELVVVDPPGRPTRVVAWGAPITAVVVGATLVGLVLGALGAVLSSIFRRPKDDVEQVVNVVPAPRADVSPARREATGPIDASALTPIAGRHRRAAEPTVRPGGRDTWT